MVSKNRSSTSPYREPVLKKSQSPLKLTISELSGPLSGISGAPGSSGTKTASKILSLSRSHNSKHTLVPKPPLILSEHDRGRKEKHPIMSKAVPTYTTLCTETYDSLSIIEI